MSTISIPRSLLELRSKSAIPLLDIVPDGVFVAGGAVRRAVCGDSQDSDVDWFFTDKAAEERAAEVMEKEHFTIAKSNDKFVEYRRGSLVVQFIKVANYPNIDAIFETFDFTICCFAYDKATDCIVTTPAAMIDLSRRQLVVHNVKYPVATMRRVGKYEKSGYTICRGGWQTIAQACKTQDIDLITEYID